MTMGTRPGEESVPTMNQTASEQEGCYSSAIFQKKVLVLEAEVRTHGNSVTTLFCDGILSWELTSSGMAEGAASKVNCYSFIVSIPAFSICYFLVIFRSCKLSARTEFPGD